ncbi:Glycosyltransferase, GT2 family OS=Bosea thiooxidans OX=53254 GN=SAMN05660750_01273 PE=4 SV=1 [Bosea thiooxidans]|uniref:Glycosyltransferase, GT2 family n=2 Tax=Bosea thiooxidans TaxID=53254 RepID=A0A1T5CBG5_9HYPH|nr:glycosyltransferase [Bosea thiooxidans]SKB56703.1 Glycosyltransferase, GT2 family [Bosea thiooxidans]
MAGALNQADGAGRQAAITASRGTSMRIIVGIATTGRREVLSDTLAQIAGQARKPEAILICPVQESDADWAYAATLDVPVRRVVGRAGSCAQRNAILDAAGEADIILFFDDDFLPARSYVGAVEELFAGELDVVVATGLVLADGIHGPGLGADEARAILARDPGADAATITPVENAYGCNMVFRMAAIRAAAARFDENLPLYGWQEDTDFSRQLAGQGRIILSTALRGVHRGSKRGRSSGLRLGYSQIANPFYLVGKGTLRRRRALRMAAGNVAANILGSLKPQGLIDRRGRLKGNCLALFDMLRGRLAPRRILSFN